MSDKKKLKAFYNPINKSLVTRGPFSMPELEELFFKNFKDSIYLFTPEDPANGFRGTIGLSVQNYQKCSELVDRINSVFNKANSNYEIISWTYGLRRGD